MDFDWSRLPRTKHADAIKMVTNNDLRGLLYLHQTYKLSDYDYTCCGLDGLKNRFIGAIENGEITAN